MKRVIFSEGKNDTIFLRELLVTKIGIDEERISFFDQSPTNTHDNRKPLQELSFEGLNDEWRRLEILAKSEGGKPKIIDIATSMLIHLCQKRYDPIILIDLDNQTIDNFKNKLEAKLIGNFKCIKLSLESSKVSTNNEEDMWKIKLFKSSEYIGSVHIVAFKTTLEDVTKINPSHTDDEKRKLAKEYIQTCRIHDMFIDAMNA